MRKKYVYSMFIFLLVSFLFVGNGYAEENVVGDVETLGLMDCVQFALENHPDMEFVRYDLEKAQIELQKIMMEDPKNVALNDLKAKEEAAKRAEIQVEKTGMQLALKIEQKYYSVLKTIQTVKSKEYALDWSKKQMDIVQLKYESGMIPEKELLAMEDQLDQAQTAYDRSLFGLETIKMEMNLALGRDLDIPFDVVVERFEFEPLEVNLEEATQYATEHSDSIRQAEEALEQAKDDLRLKEQSNASEVDIRFAKYAVEKAEYNLKSAHQQVILQVRNAYMGIVNSTEATFDARDAYDDAVEALEILTIKYEAGMIPLLELLDGQHKQDQAEANWIQAIYDYNLAKASFNQSIGKNYSLYQQITEEGSGLDE